MNFWAPVIASSILSIVNVSIYFLSRTSVRDNLKLDLELVGLLPLESSARRSLLARAESSVEKMVSDESELSRDPTGLTLAVIFLGGAITLGLTAAQSNNYWWILVTVLGMFGLVGLSQDGLKRRRDEKGNAIR